MKILAHAAGHLYSCPKFWIRREWVGQEFLQCHPQCLGMLWAYLESLYSLHFLLERESMTTVSFSTISPFNERHGRGLQILLNLPGSRYLCVRCIWTLAAVLANSYSRWTSPRAFSLCKEPSKYSLLQHFLISTVCKVFSVHYLIQSMKNNPIILNIVIPNLHMGKSRLWVEKEVAQSHND